MSTRCNVVITKKGKKDVILYHHHDGYPDGVGADLEKYLANKSFKTPSSCGNFLVGIEDDEYEKTVCLHGDIEYLYTIDLDANTIKCQEADNWDELKTKDVYTHQIKTKKGKEKKTIEISPRESYMILDVCQYALSKMTDDYIYGNYSREEIEKLGQRFGDLNIKNGW